MTYFITRTAVLGVLLAGAAACTQQQADEIVAGFGFALAEETVRLNPAVQNSLAATPQTRTLFSELRNSGAATYTGSAAFYQDANAIDDVTAEDLGDPDLMGRMDLAVDIGDFSGVMTGGVSNFVNASGQATDGELTLSDVEIRAFIGSQARISGSIGGTLTGPTGAGTYQTGVSGTFFDGGEALMLEAQTGAAAGTDAFSLLGAATRDAP